MPTASLTRAIPFFPYPQVFLPEEDALVDIFRDIGRRGTFILQQDLARFEENLARYLNVPHAIGVANATDGLLIALKSAGVRPGDEVIFSSHTMVATASAIHFAGAVPVPVDCGADHLMDPEAAASAVTSRTTAILPTHLNGRTADMKAIGRIAERGSLLIVEDAAQALGSRFQGKCAGSFGAAAALSFFPAKLLGCLGDGGAVVATSKETARRAAALHDHGRDESGAVSGWGFNSRLDNLQAAILDFRLQRYNSVVERRRAIAREYHERLQDLPEIVLPPGPDGEGGHFDVYQNYEIEAEQRDALRGYLSSQGIGTLLPWGGKAVHQWPALGFDVRLPVTERLFRRVLLLPLHPWLEEPDLSAICEKIRLFYRGKK